jgi:hypothetical protein
LNEAQLIPATPEALSNTCLHLSGYTPESHQGLGPWIMSVLASHSNILSLPSDQVKTGLDLAITIFQRLNKNIPIKNNSVRRFQDGD